MFFGRNPVSGGIPFWEEFHFGRNSVLGGILFWEESCFGRNSILGGIMLREEIPFREELSWRSPSHEGSWLGGVSLEESYGRSPAWDESQWNRNT